MSSIVVSGDTSGSVTLQAPAVAGSTVLTLPAVSGTVITTATGQTLTSPVISGTPSGVGTLTSGTAVASTSGTSIDFTGIPSWVKRITVMFNGVSVNGVADVIVQVGSGTVATTGYLTTRSYLVTSSVGAGASSSTSIFIAATNLAADLKCGHVILTNISSNIWVSSGVISASSLVTWGAGNITLSGTLDRVRITTSNGTDTFDAGSINIMYE